MTISPNPTSSLRMLPALMSESERQRAANAEAAHPGAAGPGVADASASKAPSAAAQPDGDFYKQLLTLLALSMAMPGGSGASNMPGITGMPGMTNMPGMTAGSSSSGMNFMAPVLLTLIEKLLSNQVEQAEPQAATIQKGPAEGISAASNAESFGDDVPAGMPIKGYQTQGSHGGHVAIDWGAPVGSDVKTTMNGKVVYAGWNNEGYGNLVIVENGPYRTYYAHLSKIPVQVGDRVSAGEVIGKSGNTGNSTGPHLHYEVRLNNRQVNPFQYLNKRSA